MPAEWFVKSDTAEVDILHPHATHAIAEARKQLEADEIGEDAVRQALDLIRQENTITVKLRPLNAGDIASINELKVSATGGGSVMIGEAKLLAVELALTAWTLPAAITRDTIRQLNANVLEQIFEAIDIGEGASANGTGATPTRAPAAVALEEPTKVATAIA